LDGVVSIMPELTRLETTDPRWLALVESHSDASPFHQPAWSRIVEDVYGWRSFVLAETGSGGALRAGVPIVEVANPLRPRRWVSLPYVDSCPPLAVGDAFESLADALAAERTRAGVASLEVRAPVAGRQVHTRSAWVSHELALTGDADAQLKALHGMTRRNVRIAEREGVEIRFGEGMSSLTETFYGLHVETRRRLGVPVQPRRFFRIFWREIVERDLGFVLVAYHRGEPVASAVFLAHKGRLVYKYGASSQASLNVRPNNLLFWYVIRWAADRGYTTLDFGRTAAEQHGLRSFKAGWGAVEEPLVYSYIADRAPAAPVERSSALAAPVLRHSPAWVTRALGELLYRYAA
jgi:CelD/BcsL family acetyltransferase involved in cellulose biosynthesis